MKKEEWKQHCLEADARLQRKLSSETSSLSIVKYLIVMAIAFGVANNTVSYKNIHSFINKSPLRF